MVRCCLCLLITWCVAVFWSAPVAAQNIPAHPGAAAAPRYQIINAYPHDRGAFTEGLIFLKGSLFESTGNYGESNLRKVNLATGKVLQQTNLSIQYFGEGLTALNGKLYQLTWQENKGFVYDLATFNLLTNFLYPGEGWGLTTDGRLLIMSDGTANLRYLNPATFQEERSVKVTDHGRPVKNVNELEYIQGEIFANIWMTDDIIRIDPLTGKVLEKINFAALRTAGEPIPPINVLNGIAYDPASDCLFLTGKNWPKLFKVRLNKQKGD